MCKKKHSEVQMWIRIGFSSRLLWPQNEPSGSMKAGNSLTCCTTIIFSRKTQDCGVNEINNHVLYFPYFSRFILKSENYPRSSVIVLASQIYKAFARQTSYGSEAWAIGETSNWRCICVEMHCMWQTAEYELLNHKRNEDVMTELQISTGTDFV